MEKFQEHWSGKLTRTALQNAGSAAKSILSKDMVELDEDVGIDNVVDISIPVYWLSGFLQCTPLEGHVFADGQGKLHLRSVNDLRKKRRDAILGHISWHILQLH